MTSTVLPGKLPGQSEVAAAWQAGDDDRLIKLLGQIRTRSSPLLGQTSELVSILEQTGSARVRAAVSMTLADIDAKEAVDPLIAVLRRPELAKCAGTLIFVLDELGGSLPLDLAVSLIAAGSYEARAGVLGLMEGGRIARPDPAETIEARQSLAMLAHGSDPEAAEAASLAIEYLDEALRTAA